MIAHGDPGRLHGGAGAIELVFFCAVVLAGCCMREEQPDSTETSLYTSISEYAAYKDGDDWAGAFERAFAERDSIFVPEGEYRCSEISVPSGKTVIGTGDKSVFVPLGTRLFVIEGVKKEGIPISRDIADHSNTIDLENGDSFKAGDDILIQSQRNSMLKEGVAGVNYDDSWVQGRTRRSNVFFGEFDEVVSIAGNSLTTRHNRVFPAYYKDDTREPAPPTDGFIRKEATKVYGLDMVHDVHLRNLRITGTARCYRVISLKYAKDCSVESIHFASPVETFDGNGNSSLTLVHCFLSKRVIIKDCKSVFSEGLKGILAAKDKEYSNYSIYNIFKLISCWECGFESCSADGATHAFNITRSSSADGITSGNCFVRSCTSSGNIWAGIKVVQGCWNSEVRGNTVLDSPQGIVVAGRSTRVLNNSVTTGYPLSTNFYYTHIKSNQTTPDGKIEVYWGGTAGIMLNEGYSCGTEDLPTVIASNTIKGFYTGISMRDGYEEKNIFEQGHIEIRDNVVTDCFNGFGVYRNAFNTAFVCLHIDISGNRFSHKGEKELVLGGKARQSCGVYLSDNVGDIAITNNSFDNFFHVCHREGYSERILIGGVETTDSQ